MPIGSIPGNEKKNPKGYNHKAFTSAVKRNCFAMSQGKTVKLNDQWWERLADSWNEENSARKKSDRKREWSLMKAWNVKDEHFGKSEGWGKASGQRKREAAVKGIK